MAPPKQPSSLLRIKNAWITLMSLVFFAGLTVNFIEIMMRLLFHSSIDLFYDIPIWCTVWTVLLLGGVILPEGQHISIDFVRDALHGTPRKILEVLNAFLTLVFAVVIGWGGVQYVIHLYNVQAKFTRSVPIPRWMVELCVPIGMIIFAAASVYCLFRAATSKWGKDEKHAAGVPGGEDAGCLEGGNGS